MVENASAGMNAALRCLHPPLARGDKVIYLSTEYGMTHSVLNFLAASTGIELVMVDMVQTVSSHPQWLRLSAAADEPAA